MTHSHRTLHAIANGPLGTRQIAERTGLTIDQTRKCIAEHMRAKRIASVSENCRAALYAITDEGRKHIAPPPPPETSVQRAIRTQPSSIWQYAERHAQ